MACRDISTRHFNLIENKIFLQFHYAENAITASTRTFLKPPKPDYGCETIFIPSDTKGYNVKLCFTLSLYEIYNNLSTIW